MWFLRNNQHQQRGSNKRIKSSLAARNVSPYGLIFNPSLGKLSHVIFYKRIRASK